MNNKRALAVFLSLVLAGCGGSDDGPGDPTGPTGPGPAASVSISPTEISLQRGQTLSLSATVRDAAGSTLSGKSLSWSTSDAAVATVSAQGLLAGVSAGEVTVTVAVEGVTGTASGSVTMTQEDAATAIREGLSDVDWDGSFVIGLVTDEALPAGTEISPTSGQSLDPVFTLDRPAFLGLVDLAPLSYWEHPARYVLVDAVTGELTESAQSLPPTVDGTPRWTTLDNRINTVERFAPATMDETLPGLSVVGPTSASLSTPSTIIGTTPVGAGTGTSASPLAAVSARSGGTLFMVTLIGGRDLRAKLPVLPESITAEDIQRMDIRSEDQSWESAMATVGQFTQGLTSHDQVITILSAPGNAQGIHWGLGGVHQRFVPFHEGATAVGPLLGRVRAGHTITLLDIPSSTELVTAYAAPGGYSPRHGMSGVFFGTTTTGVQPVFTPSTPNPTNTLQDFESYSSPLSDHFLNELRNNPTLSAGARESIENLQNLFPNLPDPFFFDQPLSAGCANSREYERQKRLAEIADKFGFWWAAMCAMAYDDIDQGLPTHPAEASGITSPGQRVEDWRAFREVGAGHFFEVSQDLTDRLRQRFPCPTEDGTVHAVDGYEISCSKGGLLPDRGIAISMTTMYADIPSESGFESDEITTFLNWDLDPSNNNQSTGPWAKAGWKGFDTGVLFQRGLSYVDFSEGQVLSQDPAWGHGISIKWDDTLITFSSLQYAEPPATDWPGFDVRFNRFVSDENHGFNGAAWYGADHPRNGASPLKSMPVPYHDFD